MVHSGRKELQNFQYTNYKCRPNFISKSHRCTQNASHKACKA